MEDCKHQPALPETQLTICMDCFRQIVKDGEWRDITPLEKTIRLETIRQMRDLFHRLAPAEYSQVMWEKVQSEDAASYRLGESVMGRWIIVNGQEERLAWSGSTWVPHLNGIPMGKVQVANFESRDEALSCAQQCFGVEGEPQ